MEHMKKILLRITAYVLLTALLLGLAPSASAAVQQEYVSQEQLDHSFEGKTPLGSMIVKGLDEAMDAPTGDSLYDVTDLTIGDGTATVEFYAEEDAQLVVALYTEDGSQLLASAKVDVTADMTGATLTFEEEMPRYFLAQAYLLDSYDFSPLCTPYESVRYTREIQELLDSDIHDYDPELVLNLDESEETNFAVYGESTIRICEQEGVNQVTLADHENRVYVIENADEQFTSLAEGDVLAYAYGEDQLLLAKVAGIDTDGTTVTIRGSELELQDVFDQVKIQAFSDPDTMTVDESTGAEGLVYRGRGNVSASGGDYAPNAEGTFSKSFDFDLPNVQTGAFDFSGKLGLELEVEMEVLLKGTRRFVKMDIGYTTKVTFEIDLTGDDAKLEVPISKIIVPILPRLVEVGISPNLLLKFEASISSTITTKASVGVEINQKGWDPPKVKDRCKKPEVEMSFQVEGTLFVGFELEPEILFVCGVGELNLGFETGLTIDGSLIKVSDQDDGLFHDCLGCVTGKCAFTIRATAEGQLAVLDFEATLAERKFPLPKLDFYLCMGHEENGFGECPYLLRRLTVKVRDENGDPVENAHVYCSEANILVSDLYTNSKGVAELYLPRGTHEISVRTDSLHKVKVVKVGKDPKKVTVKLVPEKPEEEEKEEKNDALDGSGGDEYIDYGKSVQSGSCGDDLTWDLYEDGTLVIDGEGRMYDYEYDFTDAIETPSSSTAIYTTAPWGRYVAEITEIEMAEGITYIGARAFALVKLPTSVEIPDSVTQIGDGAFANCVGLRSVYIGTGLECIEENAFYLRQDDWYGSHRDVYVDSLEHWLSITLTDEDSSPFTYYSGGYLYHGNNMSTDLSFPEGITEIKDYAFRNCNNMTGDLEIPESVKHIGVSAFGSTSISSVSFTSGDLYVDAWAFSGNSIMEEVHVPSLEEWLRIEFNGSSANPLSDHMGTSLGEYKDMTLYIGKNRCEDLVIPDGIEATGTYSFAGYTKLKSVTLPETLTQIPEGMFCGTGLKEVVIPERVECIGDSAFVNCYALKKAVIHSGTIGAEAFDNCINLTDVEILGGVDTIGRSAFSGCSSLRELTISEGVNTIGDWAFSSCTNVTSVEIPASVTWLGSYVFSDTLEEVRFLGDAPDVDDRAPEPFNGVYATAYYPEEYDGWNWRIQADIGYYLTWVPYSISDTDTLQGDLTTQAAPEKPTVGTDAIHDGEYGSGEMDGVTVKTADFEGLVPGAEYVLLVLASLEPEDRLAADNLLYIGHAAAAEDGTVSFTYIPKTYLDRSIVVLCGPSGKDLKDAEVTLDYMGCDGETWSVEPTVIYDGVILIEGEDYELLGAVSYHEPGTYTFWIRGIHDYTGLVEYTYTAADHIHELGEHTADGNATCTEDGTKTARCKFCDLTDTLPDEGSALGHSWDEGVVTVEPTEESEGEIFHTCTRCGVTKTEVLPRKEHIHEFEVVFEWPGTCQSVPFTVYECKTCGETYQVEGTELQPHEWDAGVITVEPTEEAEGEMLYTCTRCSKTKTEPVPRVHDCTYAFREVVEPTCYDRGYSIYVCTYCGATTEADFVDPLGHAWDEGVVTVEPTYEDWGEMRYTCTRCGGTKTEYLPPLHEHSFYYYHTVEPTCYSEGYTIYKCAYCDERSYDDYVPMIDHTWDEGVVTVEPTPETEGEMLYSCIYCDATRTEVLPRVHVHSNMVLRTVAPTCTEEGYTIYLCTGCGEVVFDDYTAALGHSFGAWTDAGNGMEERTCERCGFAEQRTAGGPVNPFTDVPAGSFYYEPVLWAVEKGITNGTTPTTFGPMNECMRAHVVTFLWRAAGSPEPVGTTNPFVDVKQKDFYYKAVLWAVEKGVTNGVDATHFGPTAYCNRAQVVTFLHRSLGSPAVEATGNPFTDVPAGTWFTEPVLWAVANGVTNGLSPTAFGPTAICNRAQIVTFLYRAFAK